MARECPLLWCAPRAPHGATIRPKAALRSAISTFLFVIITKSNQGGNPLARSNYQFNKRQKEIARKKKKEEKRQLKLEKTALKSEENQSPPQNEDETL
jgi:hypothetical protein